MRCTKRWNMEPSRRASRYGVIAMITSGLLITGSTWAGTIEFASAQKTIEIQRPALYPETILTNLKTGRFLVGSFREGAVYEVQDDGSVRLLVNDKRLSSVLGMAIDYDRQRLYAVNSDIGASIRPHSGGPKDLAALAVYDLISGKEINYIDLGALEGDSPHLGNGITLDSAGNVYVTDSFAPVIYKVTPDGQATVFLKSGQFSGDGINLNGITYHPDEFLLAVKKSDGTIFKIPLENPAKFTKVISPEYVGGDGLTLIDKDKLLLVANQVPNKAENAAFIVKSNDGWKTARTTGRHELGDVYPTTGTIKDKNIFVVHSGLNKLMAAKPADQQKMRARAIIEKIGIINEESANPPRVDPKALN